MRAGRSFVGPTRLSGARSHVCVSIAVAASIAAAVAGSPAFAAAIEIEGGDCTPRVHLVARGVPLANVLEALAQALDFELSYESDSNPTLNIDAADASTELIARLASSQNVSIAQAPNPRCPRQDRIVKVWVLPGKPGAQASAAAPPARAPMRSAMAERLRKGDEDVSEILRAHGIDPEQARRELSR